MGILAFVAGCAEGNGLSDSTNAQVGQSGYGGSAALGSGGLAAGGTAPVASGGFPTTSTGGTLVGAGGIIAGVGGYSQGTGGESIGSGGFTLGSGGIVGSGGVAQGSGGAPASGGTSVGTGGSVAGSGGASPGSGGADPGSGGTLTGTGGGGSGGVTPGSGGAGTGGTGTGGQGTGGTGTGGTGTGGTGTGGQGTGGTGTGGQGTGGQGTGGQGTGGQGTGGQGAGGATGGPTQLPTASNCPNFTNGGVVQFPRASGTNVPVTIYVDPNAKSKPAPGGPLVIYWHATLSSPTEVHQGFTDTNIQKVTSMGGVVAAPATTQCPGCTTTDDGYWFVEDDVVLDQIVACAIQQANIDTRHIHTLGWSAGGLHTCHVGVARSNYIASIISYSGGYAPWPGTMTPQDPSNHVASILTYGTSDAVIVDFPTQSKQWYSTFQPKGYYTMMCLHQGGHEIDPLIAPLSLKFFMDHPYEVSPEPYASAIPSDYPNNPTSTVCANSPP